MGEPRSKTFLINSALSWFDRYHIDGLRVDAVASMLYLDYARKNGEWVPNQYGGNENLGSCGIYQRIKCHGSSGAYPGIFDDSGRIHSMARSISRPTYVGGLGFLV